MILSAESGRIGKVSLEHSSQILEETRRIQDPVQFTGGKQNLKDKKQLYNLRRMIEAYFFSL